MSKRIKDTDYLVISARIKAMEAGLLTQDRMEQILEAHSDEEAVKILQECGYPELDATDPEALDAVLSAAREEMLSDLADGAPDPRYIEIFKLKYDYHNVKTLLKAEVMNANPDSMLMDAGRVPVEELREAMMSSALDTLPNRLAQAVAEAKSVLNRTRDPQLSDIVLDRWCYRDMEALAEETGSEFLVEYVRTIVDSVNLRTLVRALRMGRNEDFLQDVLMEGGSIPAESILAVCAGRGSGMEELYAPTSFQEAAEEGVQALKGGSLTKFEKLCDDAVEEYLSAAQYVPFGEAPLIGYLAARETEYTNLRILLMGRGAGLDPDVIRSRLRQCYV